jgi:hypothetical protein
MAEGAKRCLWEGTLLGDELLQSDGCDLVARIIANRSRKVREPGRWIPLLRSRHEIDFTSFAQELLRSGLISLRSRRILLSGLALMFSLEPLKTGHQC